MLSREELKEIAELQPDGNYFVSLYLNVNPVTNPKGDYEIHLKNMIKEASERLDKAVFKTIQSDFKKIELFIVNKKREFKKGIAVLSCSGQSFWREYNIAVPVKNEIIVDKTPYIKPLLHILDNYRRYAAVLVNKEAARLFLIYLGEIAEYADMHTPDIPGKHKKGGWFALSQNHYERHVDFHVSLHLKDVLTNLESFLKNEDIERLIIGGSEEAAVRFREMLPKAINEKAAGAFQGEMFANINEIFEKVKPVIEIFEKKREKETVNELLTMAMKGNSAVIGMDDVLNAIQEGRVMKLVLAKDLEDSGYACRNCRYLTRQKISSCPYCKSVMEKVGYLADLAGQKAVESGALVEIISENKELSNAGGIGAFLRF